MDSMRFSRIPFKQKVAYLPLSQGLGMPQDVSSLINLRKKLQKKPNQSGKID